MYRYETNGGAMAYQAFYNKYRPQKFDEVVGQKPIVTTLSNAIKEDKIAHAYLFCGPRGTGKTTMARLFAKALDCEEGLGHQCDQCQSCLKIMQGQHPDVIEIDAASNSTVDSVRQLIENVSYQPIMSRYKVYIIDEVHNMSDSAFNALLKTIEEPPSFVIFILATTDPQKVLPTILSRVQRFDFSKVSDRDLVQNMRRVLTSENINFEEDALTLIASLSDGGVRDSLSLLDKVVSYCGEHVTVKDVNDLLGLMSRKEEIDLINLISSKKMDTVLKTVQSHYEQGMDIRRLESDFVKLYKDFLIYTVTKDKTLLTFAKESEITEMKVTSEECKEGLEILLRTIRDNRLSDDIFTQFQLALINMMSERSVIEETAPKKVVKQEKVKKEESKPETKAIEIVSNNKTGFEAQANDVETSTERIQYTSDDLLYLAYHSDKDARASIKGKWEALSKFFATDKAYEARALASCQVRVVAEDVILISSKFQAEIDKLNTKNVQNTLLEITSELFGKSYHILPVLQADILELNNDFKSGKKPTCEHLNIDFGIQKKVNASTEFFDELMKG